MVEKKVRIGHAKKIGSQGATRITSQAGKFDSTILLVVGTKTINAKSIMGVLALGVGMDPELTITAEGRDETAAADAVAKVIIEEFK